MASITYFFRELGGIGEADGTIRGYCRLFVLGLRLVLLLVSRGRQGQRTRSGWRDACRWRPELSLDKLR